MSEDFCTPALMGLIKAQCQLGHAIQTHTHTKNVVVTHTSDLSCSDFFFFFTTGGCGEVLMDRFRHQAEPQCATTWCKNTSWERKTTLVSLWVHGATFNTELHNNMPRMVQHVWTLNNSSDLGSGLRGIKQLRFMNMKHHGMFIQKEEEDSMVVCFQLNASQAPFPDYFNCCNLNFEISRYLV